MFRYQPGTERAVEAIASDAFVPSRPGRQVVNFYSVVTVILHEKALTHSLLLTVRMTLPVCSLL